MTLADEKAFSRSIRPERGLGMRLPKDGPILRTIEGVLEGGGAQAPRHHPEHTARLAVIAAREGYPRAGVRCGEQLLCA